MIVRTVYQTLENRDNADDVENDGPFLCNRKNAWLGDGYYFWESFVENAHWWGCSGANYSRGYFICKAYYDFDETQCFNLIDNPDHLYLFNKTRGLLQEKGLYIPDQTTVARIIQYIKETLKIFTYSAIRVYGINSKSRKSEYATNTIFDIKNPEKYFDSTPAIQVCFFTKKSLNLRKYTIIFPEEYCSDYLV